MLSPRPAGPRQRLARLCKRSKPTEFEEERLETNGLRKGDVDDHLSWLRSCFAHSGPGVQDGPDHPHSIRRTLSHRRAHPRPLSAPVHPRAHSNLGRGRFTWYWRDQSDVVLAHKNGPRHAK